MGVARLRPGDERDILVAKFEIENEDTFNLKNIYKRMYEWIQDEGFSTIDETGEIESLYCQQAQQGGGAQHFIWWRVQMVPAGNTYYRYFLKIDFQTIRSKSIEVMEHGHKMKTDVSDLVLRVEAWLQLDYQNVWKKHWLLKHFEKSFRDRLYKLQVEAYRSDLYNTTYRLQNMIKQYLKLKLPFAHPKMFHPERGV